MSSKTLGEFIADLAEAYGECGLKIFSSERTSHFKKDNPEWDTCAAWVGEGGMYSFSSSPVEALEMAWNAYERARGN